MLKVDFVVGKCKFHNQKVANIAHAIQLAQFNGASSFKIHNEDGHFLKEYALFDGKYREVVHGNKT